MTEAPNPTFKEAVGCWGRVADLFKLRPLVADVDHDHHAGRHCGDQSTHSYRPEILKYQQSIK